MFAIQITGVPSGAVFMLCTRYTTEAEAQTHVKRIKDNSTTSRNLYAVVQV